MYELKLFTLKMYANFCDNESIFTWLLAQANVYTEIQTYTKLSHGNININMKKDHFNPKKKKTLWKLEERLRNNGLTKIQKNILISPCK